MIFQKETAAEISGTFANTFWDRLILQACHEERFALHGVTALSAFNTYLKLSRTSCQNARYCSVAAQHTDFALAQYQKALQTMRGALSRGRNPRKALIACLLVCAFEGLVGNTLTALSHARSGQKLLEEWLREYQDSKSYPAGISSPAPHIIEDQLIQAAGFFETQIIGFFDCRSADAHAELKREGSETIRLMPKIFRDMDEARQYWELIARRVMHFVCETSSRARNAQPVWRQSPTGDEAMKEDIHMGPALEQGASADKFVEFKIEQQEYAHEISRWRSAFSELYSKIKRSANRRLVTGAHTLHVKSRGIEIGLAGAMDTNNCAFDKHFAEFRDIVTVSREIIRAKKTFSSSDFTFELGIVPTLHMAAKWCRDRVIRREAISLMEWYGAREGHWDSVIMADIDTCLMNLEEAGVETEYIPESARVRIINLTANQGNRCANIEYIRGSKRTGEIRGEARIDWAEYLGNSPVTDAQVKGTLQVPRGMPVLAGMKRT